MADSKITYTIDPASIDFDELNSEEDFRRKADAIAPVAIEAMAQQAGAVAWDATQRELKQAFKGMKFQPGSSSDRSRFIRQTAGDYMERMRGGAARRELVEGIVAELKSMKASGGS